MFVLFKWSYYGINKSSLSYPSKIPAQRLMKVKCIYKTLYNKVLLLPIKYLAGNVVTAKLTQH